MEAPFLLSLILTLGLVFLPRTLADVTVSLKPGKVSELIKRCVCVCVCEWGLMIFYIKI